MFEFLSLDDFNLSRKIVGVRVDINSPIINNKVVLNQRIKSAAKTIKELREKNCRIVILGHQGRLGKPDCISFKNHLPLLEKEVGYNIKFIGEIFSKKVRDEIEKLKDGEILLLENLRFVDDEINPKKKGNLILKLESLFDYYVNDAFSLCHRNHTSIVGFKKTPNLAGRLMEKEILGLNEIEEAPKPHIYIFGGAKADDLIKLIKSGLQNNEVSYVLLTGVIGELALLARGYNIGMKKRFLEENGFFSAFDDLKKLLERYPKKFILPQDLSFNYNSRRIEIEIEQLNQKENKKITENSLSEDIGLKTIEKFKPYIINAGSIYVKGPAGNFEKKKFDIGTKKILQEVAKSKAFSYMGGGHSVTALDMFNLKEKFSYVSLAGGALVTFLSRGKLYGIEALENSAKKYDKEKDDFLVVGSNVLDTYITAPTYFNEVVVGDKIRIKKDFKKTIGGGGVNTSICISRLGGCISYLGKISEENCEFLKKELKKEGVNILESKITKKPAAKSIIIDTKDKDRIIFTYRGQNTTLDISDIKLKDLHHKKIYFSTLSENSFKTQLKIAKYLKKQKEKTIICYNPSSYLIEKEKGLNLMLKFIDVLVLNLDEATKLSKKETINSALKKLKESVKNVVIITDGSNGVYAYDGKKLYFQKAYKPHKVEDTTGAGDCFASTFFYFYSKGYGIKRALRFAAINSSSVVSKKGPIEGLLYTEDIIRGGN